MLWIKSQRKQEEKYLLSLEMVLPNIMSNCFVCWSQIILNLNKIWYFSKERIVRDFQGKNWKDNWKIHEHYLTVSLFFNSEIWRKHLFVNRLYYGKWWAVQHFPSCIIIWWRFFWLMELVFWCMSSSNASFKKLKSLRACSRNY